MKEKNITLSIDLIFASLSCRSIITMVPVEKWIEKYTLFAVSLVAYMYVLYFAIRKSQFSATFHESPVRQDGGIHSAVPGDNLSVVTVSLS